VNFRFTFLWFSLIYKVTVAANIFRANGVH